MKKYMKLCVKSEQIVNKLKLGNKTQLQKFCFNF